MQAEKISRDNIRTFVMKFYAKIIKDETVGPFFIANWVMTCKVSVGKRT